MFIPPFCPYKACANHSHPPHEPWWRSEGYHHTLCFGPVPRFRCLACGRTFSTQTFSIDYFAKRKLDYRSIERLGASSMSIRALGRHLGCSCGSVLNRFDRLSRQSLACHARLKPLAACYESVAIDGFVSFDRSQYFPNNLTISITSGSRFILEYTHATLRRSGRTREDQKRRKDLLYAGLEFEAKALERSFSELLDELSRDRPPAPNRPLVIITDEKIEYARAFYKHSLFRDQDEEHRSVHLRVNSRLPRTVRNPLFPSNYLDREIRKDQAAHRRETTCFSRNAANGMSRMATYVGWHNYAKRFLVKAPESDRASHGEVAGIDRSIIAKLRRKMFHDRVFLSLERLDAVEERIWKKLIPTPGWTKKAYLPRYAFA